MTNHLTEEEFSSLLIGDSADSRVSAHLQQCPQCRREMATMRRATADFNDFGHIWAEHQALNPTVRPVGRAGRGFRPLFALPLGGLLAACLLLLAFLPKLVSRHPGSIAHTQGPSAAEIAQDNQWLKAMSQDLQSGPDNIVIATAELQGSQRR